MTGRQDTTAGQMAGQRQDGIPIAEAAEILGLSQEAARKRLQRGTLAGYKLDDHWYVLLGQQDGRQDTAAGHAAGRQDEPAGHMAGRQDAEPIEAVYTSADAPAVALVPLAGVADQLQAFADRLAELAARNEGLALEVGQLRERDANHRATLGAKDQALALQQETIAELRRRAEAAEAERDALRAEALPQPTGEAPTVLVMQETAPAPRPTRWVPGWLRRLFDDKDVMSS